MLDVTDSLRARLNALAVKAGRHTSALALLHEEMRDIETAIRVLEKHSSTSAGQPLPDASARVAITTASDLPPAHIAPASKPAGDKSMPDMIMEALGSDVTGLGMLPQNVVDYIHQRYDPNADANHIRPGLWRLHKRERIGKTGDRYHLLDRPPSSPTLWPVGTTDLREAAM